MRGIVKVFVIVVFAAAILALVTATPSEAKRRPTIGGYAGECFQDPETDKGGYGPGHWDEPITYCCYDDGCWICNRAQADCVWDPAGLKRLPVTRPPGPGGVPPKAYEPPASGPSRPKPPGSVAPAVPK